MTLAGEACVWRLTRRRGEAHRVLVPELDAEALEDGVAHWERQDLGNGRCHR